MPEPPPIPTPGVPAVEKEPTVTKAPPGGKLFPCPRCGAKIEFDPRSRALTCPYCGYTSKVTEKADVAVVERDFEEYLDKLDRGDGETIAGRSSETRCTGCGAMVLLEDKVATEACPFCGTHLENKPEAAHGMLPPESLLPFKLDLRAARTSFEKWLHSLWFAPSQLKTLATLGQLTGVYIPYWTYDAMTFSRYSGLRGDNYLDTETYTERDAQGNTQTRTRTVTRIRWYPVSGEVQHFFDDVLVCGSKSVPAKLVDRLDPWELKRLEAFQPDFLSGFKTERYAVGLKEGLNAAKGLMEPEIFQLIRRDIGGDHQQVLQKHTQYSAITFKHLLLPVWVAHYRYQEKLFQILVNGRSGKVAGERPWSVAKIAALVLAILAVIGLILFVVAKAQGGAQANPAHFRSTHSAVSRNTTSDSVHHDRRMGVGFSTSRRVDRAASSSTSSRASAASNTRPPLDVASSASRAAFPLRSLISSDSGGSTSNVARSLPAGVRIASAHSGASGSAA
jgi:DNA-directed RNA polymerase subunit RPC12/RpoP